MKKVLFILALLASLPLWGANPAGKIIDLEGEAWITHPQGTPVLAFLGEEIYLGDAIKTPAKGGVKVLFVDDTVLIVKENSNVFISQFLFSPAAKQRKVVFNAVAGRIRTLVGKFFGKGQPVEIHTPNAVAGIRGTDIGATIKIKTTKFYCFVCELNAVSIYNLLSPEKQVSLATDQALEIIQEMPASEKNITPIPEDVQKQKDNLFDIQKGTSAQAIQNVSAEEGKQAVKEAAVPEAKSIMDQATLQKQEETTVQGTSPATADTGTEVLPGGGGAETKTVPSVTIKLPR